MNSPPDPSFEPPGDRSVPGPREGADRWTAPGAGDHPHGGAGPGYAPGYGDPYGAPSTGPYTGPSAGGPDPYGSGGPFGPGTAGWAPKPGVVPLRPLALGEILDGAVTAIRRHPRVVLGTAAVVAVVAHLIGVPLVQLFGGDPPVPGPTANPAALADAITATASAQLPLRIAVAVATVILSGLMMAVVSRAVLGAPVDAGEVWQAVRPRIVGLVGLALLTGLLGGLVVTVGALPGIVLLAAGVTGVGVVLLVLGILAGLAGLVLVTVGLALAPPAYVLEGGGVVEALKRSWTLVRPRFWPVLGITLLAGILAFLAQSLIALPFAGLSFGATALLGGGATATVLGVLFQALGGIVATALVVPFQAGVTGLLYVDQRMRREGFDIELQRAATFGPR